MNSRSIGVFIIWYLLNSKCSKVEKLSRTFVFDDDFIVFVWIIGKIFSHFLFCIWGEYKYLQMFFKELCWCDYPSRFRNRLSQGLTTQGIYSSKYLHTNLLNFYMLIKLFTLNFYCTKTNLQKKFNIFIYLNALHILQFRFCNLNYTWYVCVCLCVYRNNSKLYLFIYL